MSRLRSRLHPFWTLAVIVMLAYGALSVHAQSGLEVRVSDLERRVAQAESERLGERLARLEALTDTNNKLIEAVFGAVVLMLIERAVKMRIRRTED